jgi:PAS domain S-box-containing protein
MTTRADSSSGQRPLVGPDAFRGLLESVPDAMVVTDASGTIVIVNQRTERLFGYASHELIGQSIGLLIPERFHASHTRHFTHYSTNPEPRPMASGIELHARRKDGTECPVDISLSPMATEQGAFFCAAIRDLTPSKQLLRKSEERYRLIWRPTYRCRDLIVPIKGDSRATRPCCSSKTKTAFATSRR